MKTLKLWAIVVDKGKVYLDRGLYEPETRILTIRKGFRAEAIRFLVDPSHIYGIINKRNQQITFVQITSRKSIDIQRPKISKVTVEVNGKKTEELKTETVTQTVNVDGESVQMHNDENPDMHLANQLDYHTERAFWKGLIQSTKLALSTTLILMFAGYGIIRFVEWILSSIFGR